MEYIVFGTANTAKCFVATHPTARIAFFCDNNKNMWGTSFYEKEVISPAKLKEIYDPNRYIVVIASTYVQTIGFQLLTMGIANTHFFNAPIKEGNVLLQHEMDMLPFIQKYVNFNGEFEWAGIPFANAEKMKYNREITILIPTYKRPQLLKRAITYYGSLNSEELGIRLVILDASPQNIKSQIADFIKDMPQDRVCMPCFTENADISHVFLRLHEGLQKVETEFCAISADDDFLLQEGLEESVEFLEQYSDYFAATGKCYAFNDNNMKNIEYEHVATLKESISADAFDMRIRQWNHAAQTFFYMAFRTKEIQKVLFLLSKKVQLVQKKNLHFMEYFYYIILLSWGKIGAIKGKWIFRERPGFLQIKDREVIYDIVLDDTFEEHIDMAWEVYHSIFPNISKDEFFKIVQYLIYFILLDRTRTEKPLNAVNFKQDFECTTSPIWLPYINDRRKCRPENKDEITGDD
ncbi:TIGR00180 family glycosyltransferase [Anaerospora sp.]|uniref:TIGR00180 family glycosyltransferase n=1 Tax=Anaerospora sp. TaxID=1960278 RepID=UPI002898A0B1|nr:TIGR00180 family glycosyltransferase [Anaerospora sp.]